MTEHEAIRPEFLERYRVTTNGVKFRVERHCRQTIGLLCWKKDVFVWRATVAGWPFPEEFDDQHIAQERLNLLAGHDQCLHDRMQFGWQPVEAEAIT